MMAARLGNVLYWAACLVAAAWVAFCYYAISTGTPKPDWGSFWFIGALPGAVIWLVGRAIKYILSSA